MKRQASTALFFVMKVLLIMIVLVARASAKDIPVCDALDRLRELDGQELQFVGELNGGFYHGFGLAGKAKGEPCSEGGLQWFRSPSTVGWIALNFVTPDSTVPPELTQLEEVLKSRGVWVRVTGVVKAKPFFYSVCFKKGQCMSNGFLNEFPAMISPRSIEILDHTPHGR